MAAYTQRVTITGMGNQTEDARSPDLFVYTKDVDTEQPGRWQLKRDHGAVDFALAALQYAAYTGKVAVLVSTDKGEDGGQNNITEIDIVNVR